MKKTLQILEEISCECNNHTAQFKFNKNIEATDKYKNGRIVSANWLNELVFYYIKKGDNFLFELKNEIQKQKKDLDKIRPGDYKDGLYDELNLIEDMINARIN